MSKLKERNGKVSLIYCKTKNAFFQYLSSKATSVKKQQHHCLEKKKKKNPPPLNLIPN